MFGLEPNSIAWKARAQPIYHTRIKSAFILISCSPLTFSYSWKTLPYSVDYRETIRNLLSRAATATGKILVYAPRRWILLRCPGALAITYT